MLSRNGGSANYEDIYAGGFYCLVKFCGSLRRKCACNSDARGANFCKTGFNQFSADWSFVELLHSRSGLVIRK